MPEDGTDERGEVLFWGWMRRFVKGGREKEEVEVGEAKRLSQGKKLDVSEKA